MKKVIFLDIDGTLVGLDGKIPDSTVKALKSAKMNGHKLVICSGRSRFQIPEYILELGFDGIVGAAGAFVDYDGREIFHKYIDLEHRKMITEYLEKNGFIFSMQADRGIVTNERCMKAIKATYDKMGMDEEKYSVFMGDAQVREDVWNNDKEEKILYYNAPFALSKVQEDIAPYFEVVASSIERPNEYSGEIGITGINKATGMEIYLNAAGISREDSIAVGDGPNDLEMLEYAGIGVAMGNARTSVKIAADMVTTAINENGILNIFRKLNLC